MTIMFVGDIHLGRRARLSADALNTVGIDPKALTAARAFASVVDCAIAHEVRAVVLAGDVVDRDKDRFEAYDVLERGARRLAESGIPVIAVAGNHDGLVLPRLARNLSSVQLLGEGGCWECIPIPGGG
ncbi:MAG: exonuclease SbcD, partial [Myxococcota bacterium]